MGFVVFYLCSTSNHNSVITRPSCPYVVFYLCSTSNHNRKRQHIMKGVGCILFVFYIKPQLTYKVDFLDVVVFYLCSTSNHNNPALAMSGGALYFICVLHQTTTMKIIRTPWISCILFVFYIKPQQHPDARSVVLCCILFVFYIKPQLSKLPGNRTASCILFVFYIKPQPAMTATMAKSVVFYLCSTSNHNLRALKVLIVCELRG